MSAHFYNVFARRDEPAIRCAIIQERPIPFFIQSEAWEFSGTVRPSDPVPRGFRHQRAEDATRVVGFYVFLGAPVQRH